MAKILKSLKTKYTLALVTTNTKEYISHILEAASLESIYDIIYAVEASVKPQREKLFEVSLYMIFFLTVLHRSFGYF